MEDVGIDEAFLDISGSERSSEEISRGIKKRVLEETGLTCSIGIAPNKLLAKIASDMEKPDGLTIITEADVGSRIWSLAVRKLWGVGPKTEEHLKTMGIETIGGPSFEDYSWKGCVAGEWRHATKSLPTRLETVSSRD